MCHNLPLCPSLLPHSLLLSPLYCCLSVSRPRSLLPGHVLSSHSPDPPSSSCPPDALELSLLSPLYTPVPTSHQSMQLPDLLRLLVTCNSFLHQALTSHIGPDPLFPCQNVVVVMLLLSLLSSFCFLNSVIWTCIISTPPCLSVKTFHGFIPSTLWI